MALHNIDEQLCSSLDQYLQEVNKKYIKLNDEDTKMNVKATLEVVNYVVDSLKKSDSRFDRFEDLVYCGSFYDGLRVKEATEFDMNLVMNTNHSTGMPIKMDIVDGEKITIRRNVSVVDSSYRNHIGVLKDCMDESGFVRADEINSWLQSLVDTRFNSSDYQTFKHYQFRFRTNPPARTLQIYTKYKNFEIDVDLVPAVRFHNRLHKLKNILKHHDILAVPKSYSDGNIYWRAAFPEQEKELLSDCGNLLYIGRLLKGLREKIKLNLKTYHIKILLLYEAELIKLNPQYKLFWQKSPGYLFIYMLKKLEDALEQKSLRGFWMSEERLRNQYSSTELTNMYNQVKRVRERLVYTLNNLGQHDLKVLINQLFSD